MRWAGLILVLLMAVDVWYRAHTFGPDVRAATGIDLWPRTIGASEPLDCDEAAYAYMGHRVLRGDVLYRDLTEYKPPLGYWIYTLAVAVGGYNELAIRLMAIPFVLATIAAVWWMALRLGGPVAAGLAAGLYVLLSTDPFLFGNGSNLEHFINLFSVLSLAMIVRGWDRGDRRWIVGAGVCLGAAALVKQVALAHALVIVPTLLLRGWRAEPRDLRRGLLDVVGFGLGVSAIVAVATTVVVARGAGRSAYEDIILQARALATDTLPEANAPSPLIRWLTGNADPNGRLPWPFGTTDYLVWWGSGSWPLWLASVPALAYLAFGPGSDARRRLAAGWTLTAWMQVVLPGLYWQHYYLLPIPGVAIAVAVALAGLALGSASSVVGGGSRPRPETPADARSGPPGHARSPAGAGSYGKAPVGRRPGLFAVGASLVLTLAIGWTAVLQARYYLGVPPAELTIRYKGGRQWVVLREMGRDIGRRSAIWEDPRLYVWGWQSPLYFYSGLDSPTRHFFVDNLLRDQAGRDHPLIGPRVEEIVATLRRRPPELIEAAYPPFPALRAFLSERYLPSRLALGLWVRRDQFGRFEAADQRGTSTGATGAPPRSTTDK
jgi:4-amino-4-deoxy-L-arabinose transferase-like glycosyltransferase